MKKLATTIIAILLLSFTCWAENPNPDINPPQPDKHAGHDNGHHGAPIDGGLWILLVMGAIYGSYKIYKIRKNNLKEQV